MGKGGRAVLKALLFDSGSKVTRRLLVVSKMFLAHQRCRYVKVFSKGVPLALLSPHIWSVTVVGNRIHVDSSVVRGAICIEVGKYEVEGRNAGIRIRARALAALFSS